MSFLEKIADKKLSVIGLILELMTVLATIYLVDLYKLGRIPRLNNGIDWGMQDYSSEAAFLKDMSTYVNNKYVVLIFFIIIVVFVFKEINVFIPSIFILGILSFEELSAYHLAKFTDTLGALTITYRDYFFLYLMIPRIVSTLARALVCMDLWKIFKKKRMGNVAKTQHKLAIVGLFMEVFSMLLTLYIWDLYDSGALEKLNNYFGLNLEIFRATYFDIRHVKDDVFEKYFMMILFIFLVIAIMKEKNFNILFSVVIVVFTLYELLQIPIDRMLEPCMGAVNPGDIDYFGQLLIGPRIITALARLLLIIEFGKIRRKSKFVTAN